MGFRLGVCYYPEHWPVERWATDARLMREAGLEIVRIGEFAWAQMEPEEGRFDWAWLDRAVETLAGEGLNIVMGTPTPIPRCCRSIKKDASGVSAHGATSARTVRPTIG
jgi:beta-galactosidase